MSSPVTALARRESPSIVAPQTFSETLAFAERIANTSFVPKDMRGDAGAVLAAVQFGAELGIGPMQALRNLHVIDGKVGMSGDLMLGLARGTGDLAHYDEHFVEAAVNDKTEPTVGACPYCGVAYDAHPRPRGAELHAYVVMERRGLPRHTYSFAKSDADRVPAQEKGNAIRLSQKAMYRAWPQRMYLMRAREFALRTDFADLFAGVYTPEELADSPAIDVKPEPVAAPPSPWADVPEALQPRLVEAFRLCRTTAAAQRVKLHEYQGRYEDLLEFLRGEYAARNNPKGRRKVPKETKPAAPSETQATPPPATADEHRALDAEIVAKEGGPA